MKLNNQEIMKYLMGENLLGSREIVVNWTGTYPNLCRGQWDISIDGVPVKLPEDKECSPMGTLKEYPQWTWGDGWEEVWTTFTDGLDFPEWIAQNEWVEDLNLTPDEVRRLYEMIREEDWRHGSCGGCI